MKNKSYGRDAVVSALRSLADTLSAQPHSSRYTPKYILILLIHLLTPSTPKRP